MTSVRTLTLTDVRRLSITRQHLGVSDAGMVDVFRDLGCVQLDPISAVARSHQLVLWSRLGAYAEDELRSLLWKDGSLFEYWAHAASIVRTEDYPLHHYKMRHYVVDDDSAWGKRMQKWLEEYAPMREMILTRLREEGAMFSRDFDDDSPRHTNHVWYSGRMVPRMLDYLWTRGEIMVAGRKGNQRQWDLAERVLPEWTPREVWEPDKVCYEAAQIAIRALGVARDTHIKRHFTRNRYPNLPEILGQLVQHQLIEPVNVINDEGTTLAGTWYMHTDDIPLLDALQNGAWKPRTTLLSPFDNLICDRERTETLWDFVFRIEIYVPKDKRQYGYYVLPILHGDRLIGRIDPKFNKRTKTLEIFNVFAEPDAPDDSATLNAIRENVASLAAFIGAESVRFDNVPPQWQALTAM